MLEITDKISNFYDQKEDPIVFFRFMQYVCIAFLALIFYVFFYLFVFNIKYN
jgi:hypothetical protein